MGIIAAIGQALKLMSLVAVPIVDRIKAKDEAIKNFFERSEDAVGENSMSDLAKEEEAENAALDEEMKKRGINPQ